MFQNNTALLAVNCKITVILKNLQKHLDFLVKKWYYMV